LEAIQEEAEMNKNFLQLLKKLLKTFGDKKVDD